MILVAATRLIRALICGWVRSPRQLPYSHFQSKVCVLCCCWISANRRCRERESYLSICKHILHICCRALSTVRERSPCTFLALSSRFASAYYPYKPSSLEITTTTATTFLSFVKSHQYTFFSSPYLSLSFPHFTSWGLDRGREGERERDRKRKHLHIHDVSE